MLNKILFTILILAVCILGFASVRQYDRYKQVQRADQELSAQRDAEKRAVEESNAQRLTQLEAEHARLSEQCSLGATAWENLTYDLKLQLQAPQCTVESAQ
ncbi:MAG TPA: hypothetical protein PKD15_00730 [Candidatus Saccharibacteria bacterium]|nr:hypothetical protein [Candidatus Saccharibacteria bacterium]